MSIDEMNPLLERLDRIEAALELLVKQRMVKDWYSTEETAEVLGRTSYTVREWCRQGRIRVTKRDCGRGKSQEWIVSHAELERIKNHGLLPLSRDTRDSRPPR
jgi:hypothetical protein